MSIFDLFKKIEQPKSENQGPPEWVIVGLGNPGAKYEMTRHNAGFLALDVISTKHNIQVNRMKFSSLVGQGTICGKSVMLLKPQKFMNLSGECVREAVEFYKIPMERVIVIYDDVSLAPGRIRIRAKGSAGGHNGIKNILLQSRTDIFPRIKIGVGEKPHPEYDMADWVLSKFTPDEQRMLEPALDNAAAAAEKIITCGTAQAANAFNSANA